MNISIIDVGIKQREGRVGRKVRVLLPSWLVASGQWIATSAYLKPLQLGSSIAKGTPLVVNNEPVEKLS